ncbi:MAG: hypothetical protein KC431_00360, partial [Myxococcales bacterium]|nr:hypothetical protein [Myxococcales bacterium]
GGTLPWSIDGIDLGEAGWHTIELVGTSGVSRRIDLELRVPTVGTWLDDIQPLAELHCATNGCHGPEVADMGRPVLSDYEGWVLSADAIRARVGLSGDMPPPAARLPTWDAEEVALILTWLEAGMPIGSE